jgi:hypothetical protein
MPMHACVHPKHKKVDTISRVRVVISVDNRAVPYLLHQDEVVSINHGVGRYGVLRSHFGIFIASSYPYYC